MGPPIWDTVCLSMAMWLARWSWVGESLSTTSWWRIWRRCLKPWCDGKRIYSCATAQGLPEDQGGLCRQGGDGFVGIACIGRVGALTHIL